MNINMRDPHLIWKDLARQGKLDPQAMTQLLADLPVKAGLALLSTEVPRLLDRGVVSEFMMDPRFRERHSDGVTQWDVVAELLNRVVKEQRARQEKARKKQQAVDPWAKMAIEAQFRPLVNGSRHEPATLQYLEEHIEDEEWEYYSDSLELVCDELRHLLSEMQYAQALVKVLWFNYEDDDGKKLTVDEAMDMVLDKPDDLMGLILEYLETFK